MRLCLFPLLFLPLATNAQHPIRDYVQQKALAIRSISSDSTNFSDLEGIGDAIGNSRIVLLGE